MTKEKSRYFTCLFYPESLPDEWVGSLQDSGYAIAISPLHDSDVVEKKYENLTPEQKAIFDSNGVVYKKSHYHAIIVASNPVTSDAVRRKLQRLLCPDAINKVAVIRTTVGNVYAYLTHESRDAIAKNKHVYSSDDIVLINNFDVDRYDVIDKEEKDALFYLSLDLIRAKKFMTLIDFYNFVDAEGEAYGLPTGRLKYKIFENRTGMVKMMLDGNFQKYKRPAEQLERLQKFETKGENEK